MNKDTLTHILTQVAQGDLKVSDAEKQFTNLSYEDIDYAHIDHHRSLRKGFPEVIFGEGKTPEQITGILERMMDRENVILVTRVDPEKAKAVLTEIPQGEYFESARILRIQKEDPALTGTGKVLIISAGTSDIPVADEAALTARAMGNDVETLFDVGVAGIHRLFAHREKLAKAAVIIVVAGMEGALPSVVGGMVSAPVIAVPTSVGYGTSFGGMTALLGMLNSCSSNIAVVNIDNGFGAGYMASCINHVAAQ
ncbi:MAG: nickel pincer cofactor biosynthesis protein LarB [Desulfobacterales bacterium]|nr:nickel pincer cofactor biosynthesis protein LarB [Desulfobacterales bacterium]